MTFECGVCYSDTQEDFKDCKECNNLTCIECYNKLILKKCPYCRTKFLTNSLNFSEEELREEVLRQDDIDFNRFCMHRFLDQYLDMSISLDDFIELLSPDVI